MKALHDMDLDPLREDANLMHDSVVSYQNHIRGIKSAHQNYKFDRKTRYTGKCQWNSCMSDLNVDEIAGPE